METVSPATKSSDGSGIVAVTPHAPPLPVGEKRPVCWWEWSALAVMLLAASLLLWSHFYPAISEPDANGYWAQGSLISQMGQTYFVPASPAQYIGMHWLLTPDGNYISRYPPGLAVLVALVYSTLGYKASVMINPALAVLSLAGMFFLSRKLLPRPWPLLCVALLGLNITFLQHAMENDSHMAVLACLVWGLWLVMLWVQHGHLWQMFLAGLVLGCIPTIRYPDATMGGAIVVFLLMNWRTWPRPMLHYLIGALGAALPIVPLLIRNQRLLGAFWRTGYALTNEQTGFGWDYFTSHFTMYIRTLHGDGMGVLFILAAVGLVVMMSLRPWRRLGILLTLLTVPMVLLYMAYYWAMGMGNGTMRFLLPTFPCLVIAGVWMVAELLRSAPVAARIAVPSVLVLVQVALSYDSLAYLSPMQGGKAAMVAVTDALDEVAGKDDVVLAPGQMVQHLDFVRHWKVADSTLSRGLMGIGGGRGGFGGGMFAGGPMGGPPMGGPMGGPPDGGMGPGMGGPPGMGPMGGGFGGGQPPDGMGAGPGGGFGGRGMMGREPGSPSPMQVEKQQVRMKEYSSTDGPAEFAHDVGAWAAGHKIYLVGSESTLTSTASGAPASYGTVKIIKHVKLPVVAEANRQIMGQGNRGNRFAMAGGPMGAGGAMGGFGPRAMGAGPMGRFGMFAAGGETEMVIAEWQLR